MRPHRRRLAALPAALTIARLYGARAALATAGHPGIADFALRPLSL